MTFAILGAPNSGKSVLFNFLTGLHQKVANYPGCTVMQKKGEIKFAKKNFCIDLPGTYSLHHKTKDASIATEHVLQYREKGIDEFFLVCNSTALHRSLILALQLKKMKIPVSLVLNMQDELLLQGGKIDIQYLKDTLQIPVFFLSATRRWNIMELVEYIRQRISASEKSPAQYTSDPVVEVPTVISIEPDVVSIGNKAIIKLSDSHALSERLDSILLHPLWGRIILMFFSFLIFQSIFTWATPIMDGISYLFEMFSVFILDAMPDSWISSLIAQGLITGLGSVLVFLPQIIMISLAIGIMEKTGYMARATFLMDSLLRKIGLQGKVFIPLLSGHACAIPGIMACRTIADPLNRLITIFTVPFMSCSARLPVYILLITAFIPDQQLAGFISIRTVALFSLYLAGSIVGILVAGIVKSVYARIHTITTTSALDRIGEIPVYRIPTLSSLTFYTWHRVSLFLRRAGSTILCISVIFWILTHIYPSNAGQGIEFSLAGIAGKFIHPFFAPLGLDWQSSTAVLTGITAREVFISTASLLYHVETTGTPLVNAISTHISYASGMALLIYYVYAPQCLATFAVMLKETRNFLFTLGSFIAMFILAYGLAFCAYTFLR